MAKRKIAMTIEDLVRTFDQMQPDEQVAMIDKIRKARAQFVREKLAIRTTRAKRVSASDIMMQKILDAAGDEPLEF